MLRFKAHKKDGLDPSRVPTLLQLTVDFKLYCNDLILDRRCTRTNQQFMLHDSDCNLVLLRTEITRKKPQLCWRATSLMG